MSGYVLSPRAERDLDEIWDYTAERWDVEQADRYILDLRQIMQLVANDPRTGRSCDEIRPGYRRYPAGSHMVFFRVVAGGIDIARVLHQRMDYPRHL